MEIKELVEKELNKIEIGEFVNIDNVKLTSDLGKDIMINIIKNLTVTHSSIPLKDKEVLSFEEYTNKFYKLMHDGKYQSKRACRHTVTHNFIVNEYKNYIKNL